MHFNSSDNSKDFDDSTTLKVHFKDLTCIKYRRDMYMTWDGLFGNFLFPSKLNGPKEFHFTHDGLCFMLHFSNFISIASFGGIFGLCLGGSVISLVELLYFYTLRLYSIIINRGTCPSKSDTKHVSINKNVKTVVIDPKSFLQNFQAYQQFHRQSKLRRNKRMFELNANTGILIGEHARHDFNRPIVHAFLE